MRRQLRGDGQQFNLGWSASNWIGFLVGFLLTGRWTLRRLRRESEEREQRIAWFEAHAHAGQQATDPTSQPITSHAVGLALEDRCARVLEAQGWLIQRTPASHDGGVDLIATRLDTTGIRETAYVQCKHHSEHVGVEVVRQLLGVLPMDRTAHAILAVPVGLTAAAARLAQERNVIVWDEAKLVTLESGAPTDPQPIRPIPGARWPNAADQREV